MCKYAALFLKRQFPGVKHFVSDAVRTTPAGLAEERFGGFHCYCNIVLPLWSRNSGV